MWTYNRAVVAFLLGMFGVLGGCVEELRYPRASTDDLRVTRVVLYQNGIGYFERRGRVDDDVVRLRIRPEQIADILKSLTVIDLRDGRAVSVALPVEKSRAKALSELPEQVRRSGGFAAIAAAFKGARAEVTTTEGTVGGRIVGVEEISQGEGKAPETRLTLMVGSTLKPFRLADITGLRILDKTLEMGLTKALDVALDEGAWKPVELTIHLSGKKPHDLLVTYVVEMPTWKPAYRIVLDKDGKALLQGWAVVDNVSGEDWNGVSLSLTAGTPLTFTYDLYTPRFVKRQDLSPAEEEVAAAPPPPPPVVADMEAREEEGEKDKGIGQPPPMPSRQRALTRAGGGKTERSRLPEAPPPSAKAMHRMDNDSTFEGVTPDALERNFRSLVQGSRVGALYRYDLEEKVYVPDRQSALVSLLNARVKAEEILLYNV